VALVATLGTCALLAPDVGPLLLVTAALAGALMGFMWFNLNPALIFMGDAGSLFVGFVLSAVTLRAGGLSSSEAFPIVPALLLAVPLYDTCDAIRRRTLSTASESRSAFAFLRAVKSRVFAPDGLHVHHRLVRAEMSVRSAVARLWLVAAMFAVSGCLLERDRLAGALAFGASVLLAWRGARAVRRRTPQAVPHPLAVPVVVPAEGPEPAEQQRAA
jgi:UDP-GlcNAc:undecaprenyl-phosphate GlcNAc-1-phosphate transferase